MSRDLPEQLRASGLLQPGDHVICAVSGGRDSMALLHGLLALAPQLSLTVTAAHMDHQLRGEESRRDAAFVSSHCAALGVPCTVKAADVPAYAAAHGLGTEEAARHLRYEFLLSLDPAAKIATAHNAEDNLETVLMHLLRGSGLHGLTGIPPVRGQIIRPLLSVSRRNIDSYLNQYNIPYVEDSTNHTDDYLRNRIRHQVLPLLQAENPALSQSAVQMTELLRQEDEYLMKTADALLSKAREGAALSLPTLLGQHIAIQRRMLRAFLSPVPDLTRRHLESALALCGSDAPSGRLSLPGGYTLRREYHLLYLESDAPTPSPPAPVTISGPGEYPFGAFTVTCRRGPCPAQLPKNTIALSAARLTAPLHLRPCQTGDRICLPGGSKKLSRLLMDLKIPAPLRPYIPVAVAGDTVAAVLPCKAAKYYSPAPGEDSLLLTAVKTEV